MKPERSSSTEFDEYKLKVKNQAENSDCTNFVEPRRKKRLSPILPTSNYYELRVIIAYNTSQMKTHSQEKSASCIFWTREESSGDHVISPSIVAGVQIIADWYKLYLRIAYTKGRCCSCDRITLQYYYDKKLNR
jgi:hypothetical protein